MATKFTEDEIEMLINSVEISIKKFEKKRNRLIRHVSCETSDDLTTKIEYMGEYIQDMGSLRVKLENYDYEEAGEVAHAN